MNKELLNELKLKLEKEKREIEENLQTFANKDENLKGDWDTRFPSAEEGSSHTDLERAADQVEEYGNLLPVEHNLEMRLKDISLALEKIKNGGYGKCENCNKEISEERLKAYPAARLCLDCGKKK